MHPDGNLRATVCVSTQPLPFLWPAGIPFVCIIHFKTAVAHPHDVDAQALINILAEDSEDLGGGTWGIPLGNPVSI